jgi:hypothetical protein
MRCVIKGRVIAPGLADPKGFIEIAIDTSGRGDVQKIRVFADKESGRFPAAGQKFLDAKVGQEIEIEADVWANLWNDRAQLSVRPLG